MSTKIQGAPLSPDKQLITEPDPDNPWIALYAYALTEGDPRIRYARFPTKGDACAWARKIAPGWIGRNIMVMRVEACFINIGVVVSYGAEAVEPDTGEVF